MKIRKYLEETVKTQMRCNECGKEFSKAIGPKTFEVKCPKCGSYDTEPTGYFGKVRKEGLMEATTAESVAKDMYQKKGGKDNDATPQEISAALEKAGLPAVKSNYEAVANFLDKKGFHVWKRLKHKGYGAK